MTHRWETPDLLDILDRTVITGVAMFDAAADLLDGHDAGDNPEYERALVELLLAAFGLSSDEYRDMVRDALGLPSLRKCGACGERYSLDDGYDWGACPAHAGGDEG